MTISAITFVTVYLGAGFTKLTFDPETRRMPLVLLTLVRFDDVRSSSARDAALSVRMGLFDNYDYAVIFEGSTWISSDGNNAEQWHHVLIESFAVTSDFVNAATDPTYDLFEKQYADAGVAEFAQYVSHVELTASFNKPVVLLLSDALADHHQALVDVVNETLGRFDGRIHFAVPVIKIDGNSEQSVQYFALIEFDDTNQIIAWLGNTIRKSKFTHLRKHIDNLSLVVATPG